MLPLNELLVFSLDLNNVVHNSSVLMCIAACFCVCHVLSYFRVAKTCCETVQGGDWCSGCVKECSWLTGQCDDAKQRAIWTWHWPHVEYVNGGPDGCLIVVSPLCLPHVCIDACSVRFCVYCLVCAIAVCNVLRAWCLAWATCTWLTVVMTMVLAQTAFKILVYSLCRH